MIKAHMKPCPASTASTRFSEIMLRPRLVLVPGTDRERALRMLEKSEKHCLVSASLSTPIRVEAEITES